MLNEELINFIKESLGRNFKVEEIKKLLIEKNWLESEIDEAVKFVNSPKKEENFLTVQKNKIEPTSLFGKTWAIYKERFWIFMGIMLLPLLIYFVFNFVFENFFNFSWISGILLPFVGIIFFLYVLISLLYAIKDSKENISIKESYKRGWCNFLPFLKVSLLVSIIMLMVETPFLYFFRIYSKVLDNIFELPFFIIFIVFSIILPLISIIIIILAGYIIVTENLEKKNIIKNILLKIKYYIKEHWEKFLSFGIIYISPILLFLLLIFLLSKDSSLGNAGLGIFLIVMWAIGLLYITYFFEFLLFPFFVILIYKILEKK